MSKKTGVYERPPFLPRFPCLFPLRRRASFVGVVVVPSLSVGMSFRVFLALLSGAPPPRLLLLPLLLLLFFFLVSVRIAGVGAFRLWRAKAGELCLIRSPVNRFPNTFLASGGLLSMLAPSGFAPAACPSAPFPLCATRKTRCLKTDALGQFLSYFGLDPISASISIQLSPDSDKFVRLPPGSAGFVGRRPACG